MFRSPAPTPDEHSLTGREAEVLNLIVRGLNNNEIAEVTSLSINSIKSFIRSAYRKIGVEKRQHAIEWALDRGYGPTGSVEASQPTQARHSRKRAPDDASATRQDEVHSAPTSLSAS